MSTQFLYDVGAVRWRVRCTLWSVDENAHALFFRSEMMDWMSATAMGRFREGLSSKPKIRSRRSGKG